MSFAQQTARLLSALNTVNATLVQAGVTKLHGINLINGAAVTYLKLYDKATAPAETDTPRRTIQIPANANFDWTPASPLAFQLGLGYRLTAAAADNDTTAVAAAAVTCLNIDFS